MSVLYQGTFLSYSKRTAETKPCLPMDFPLVRPQGCWPLSPRNERYSFHNCRSCKLIEYLIQIWTDLARRPSPRSFL